MRPPLVLLFLLGSSAALAPASLSVASAQNESLSKTAELNPRTFISRTEDSFEKIPWVDIDTENDSESGSGSMNPRQINETQQTYTVERISKDAELYLTSPWLTIFVPSFYTLVVTLSLPLNFMAILVFVIKMKMKKPAVVYMINLASADILFVSVLPFKIAYHFSGNNWVFGPEMCRLITAAFYGNMYCSILLMMAISIDRFLAVVYPMQSLSWRTVWRAYMVCFAIWIVSVAGVTPLLVTEQTKRIHQLNITTCHDVLSEEILRGYYLKFFTIFSCAFFFVPLIVCSVCYVRIIQCLSSSDIVAKQSKKKTRALLLSITVFSVFVMCFGPTNVLLLIHYINFSYKNPLENIYFAYLLCVCISSVSCCIDPLIYYYSSSECQQRLNSLLCCKENSELCSSSTSGQLMTRTSRRDTSTSTLSNSVYRKLLT
ncbi:proteinase-activated receptor 1-like isoform X2 [Hemicordylus capensis]|uniref:proteinase-activated receptor 1-like isoform X2 n=1 Tax=Hemicordylus capensis TaxID=884348 RepID=UPI002303409A|nr:proteinase-activated receptor 1-like isoform X2 [Hemicordylus capensis]